jgi:RNA polymerase sigma-70 factor (ECF subfamily)
MTFPPESTQGLVARAQGGERQAFDELFRLYQDRLHALVASRLGAHLRRQVTVEDAVQDTLVKALQALGSFHWEGEDSFFRWLSTVAENVILYHARRDAVSQRISLPPRSPASESPSKGLAREERFDRLKEALESLPEDYRQVILLVRIDGMSVQEAAARLGRSTAATSQLLWRALQKLKQAFGDTRSFSLPERSLKESVEEDLAEEREAHEP